MGQKTFCDPHEKKMPATELLDSVASGQTKMYKGCLVGTPFAHLTGKGARKPPLHHGKHTHLLFCLSAAVATCLQVFAMWVRVICGFAPVHRRRRCQPAQVRDGYGTTPPTGAAPFDVMLVVLLLPLYSDTLCTCANPAAAVGAALMT